jgi:small subunit ribosomal protein S17
MAEKNEGTSADAEVPNENQEDAAQEAAADVVEAAQAADEPVETLVPSADEAVTEEPATAEPVAEAAATEAAAEPESGASSQAEAPAPKKRRRQPRPLRRQRPKAKRERPKERRPITRLPKPEHERANRQERQGTVVSDAMEKTIVVKVDVIKAHPKYKKVVRRSTKFHAHDERNQAKVGDVVRIVETRPLSKQKRWRLAEIVEAAK